MLIFCLPLCVERQIQSFSFCLFIRYGTGGNCCGYKTITFFSVYTPKNCPHLLFVPFFPLNISLIYCFFILLSGKWRKMSSIVSFCGAKQIRIAKQLVSIVSVEVRNKENKNFLIIFLLFFEVHKGKY